jgi:hypothetical protein
MEAEGWRSAPASASTRRIGRALDDEFTRRHPANGLQLQQGNTKNAFNSTSARFLTAPRALA